MERSAQRYEVPDTVPYRKGDLWGFVNQAGETVIPFEYGFTSPYVEDRASVLDRATRLGTYLDRQGKPIAPFIYDKVVPFQYGLGLVKQDGKWGALDKDGKLVIECQYEDFRLTDLPNHGFVYAKRNGKWGVIDKANNELFPFKYDALDFDGFEKDVMWASQDRKEGYLNKQFEWVIPPKKGRIFGHNSKEGLINVSEYGKYGYLNERGDTVIPFQFSQALRFSSGLAPVKFNHHDPYVYFIDPNGNKVDSIEAHYVGDFVDGIAEVDFNGPGSAYINTKFEKIFEGDYVLRPFEDKYAIIRTIGDTVKFGLIDRSGSVLIEAKYEFLAYLEKQDILMFRQNGLVGLMTLDEEVIHPATLRDVELDINGDHGLLLLNLANGKAGYIDNKGKKYYDE